MNGYLLLGVGLLLVVVGVLTFFGRDPLVYPKPNKEFPKKMWYRPWIVEADLAYDGGGSHWVQYCRTKMGANFCGWWNYYISSWGGWVKIYPNKHPGVYIWDWWKE